MKTKMTLAALFALTLTSVAMAQQTQALQIKGLTPRPDSNDSVNRRAHQEELQDQHLDGRQPTGRFQGYGMDWRQQPGHRRTETVIQYKTVTRVVQKYVYDPYTGTRRLQEFEVQEVVPVEVKRPIVNPWEPEDPPFDPNPRRNGLELYKLGVTLEPIGAHSFEVVRVSSGGIAGRMGIQRGDRLTRINEGRIHSFEQLEDETRSSFTIRFYRSSSNSFHWAEHKESGWQPWGRVAGVSDWE